MSQLEMRLLGGFEVRDAAGALAGFESQKVRALVAYLALHRTTESSRELLVDLLWPRADEATARQNLRQALYNIRRSLTRGGASAIPQPLQTSRHAVRFDPGLVCWVDAEAFDEVQQALRRGRPDHTALAQAARLYRGEFLAGLTVVDSRRLEEWYLGERERLREGMLEVLRELVEHHTERGELRQAIGHARRLLGFDPLHEEAHRQLMRLYALAGRRNRALLQYRTLESLLGSELGVAPASETAALYQALHSEPATADLAPSAGGLPSPVVPMVGRDTHLATLRNAWREVCRGNLRCVLLLGEAGSGKTRLAKTFLSEAATDGAPILLAASQRGAPPAGLWPFANALAAATDTDGPLDAAVAALGPAELAELRCLLPDLRTEAGPTVPSVRPGRSAKAHLFAAIARLLELSCRTPMRRPLVVFLDDFDIADSSSLELVRYLCEHLSNVPVMLLAAARPRFRPDRLEFGTIVKTANLGWKDLRRLAEKLVGEPAADGLAQLLDANGHGLPLAIVELLNLLRDRGLLVPTPAGRWVVRDEGTVGGHWAARVESLDELLLERVRLLPTSARRLITLAAVAGHSFEPELLQAAGREHPTVVEATLEILVDSWMVRPGASSWTPSPHARDVLLSSQGMGKGSFEFTHELQRDSIYGGIPADRRSALHADIARAISVGGGRPNGHRAELLAHHYLAAGMPVEALPHLEVAADRARALGADDVLRHYLERGLEAALCSAVPETRARVVRREFSRELTLLRETVHS
jgi:DNA-binding SARP family transcriptional activator